MSYVIYRPGMYSVEYAKITRETQKTYLCARKVWSGVVERRVRKEDALRVVETEEESRQIIEEADSVWKEHEPHVQATRQAAADARSAQERAFLSALRGGA